MSAIFSILTEEGPIQYIFEDIIHPIPTTFTVPATYDTPVKDQGSLDNSWIFAFIAKVEAEYRHQSIKDGDFETDFYVPFSEQYFMSSISYSCSKPNASMFCFIPSNPFSTSNQTSAVLPSLISQLPNLTKSIFPQSICPYNGTSDGEFTCANFSTTTTDSNPITFSISNVTWATSVRDIKQLLVDTNHPIILSMPQPMMRRYTSCTTTRVVYTEACQLSTVRCPQSFSEKYCYTDAFPAHTGSGEYFLPSGYLDAGSPVSFLLVGYTDSFVPSHGYSSDPNQKRSRGGFIVKNSMSAAIGYPISYYDGSLSSSDAFDYCPNDEASHLWLGPQIQCSSENFSTCPAITPTPGMEAIESDTMADILICTDGTYCNTSGNYSLVQMPSATHDNALTIDTDGNTRVPMYEQLDTVQTVAIDEIPFHRLNTILKKMTGIRSNKVCGYWFIPYDLVNAMSTMNGGALNGVVATNFNIDFGSKSFLKAMTSGAVRTMVISDMKAANGRPKTSYDL